MSAIKCICDMCKKTFGASQGHTGVLLGRAVLCWACYQELPYEPTEEPIDLCGCDGCGIVGCLSGSGDPILTTFDGCELCADCLVVDKAAAKARGDPSEMEKLCMEVECLLATLKGRMEMLRKAVAEANSA